MKKYADIRVDLTVAFEDDGENSLQDQALDAARDIVNDDDADFEIVGAVRDTEWPAQRR